MNSKILAVILVAILVASGVGVALVALKDGGNKTPREDYFSTETVKDAAGRDAPIPKNLDGGIVTVGRLSTLRWLAYFPDEMNKVVMVDDGIMKAVKKGGVAYTYAYADIIKKAKVHSSDSVADAEEINKLNPSLILVNSMTYNKEKDRIEAMARINPLAVIDTMNDMEASGFWKADYTLHERFVKQADLYGKLLKNEKRAGEVKKIFSDTLKDIRSLVEGNPKFNTYIGGPINMGANPLSSTYNPYLPHDLVGGKNAYPKVDKEGRIDSDPETVNALPFDCMVVDPGTYGVGKESQGKSLIFSQHSQGILLGIYNRNNAPEPTPGQNPPPLPKVRIFITMPMISHGANWDCVLGAAYYMAYLNYDTISKEKMVEKIENVFKSFYGDERGKDVLKQFSGYYEKTGKDLEVPMESKLFEEVKVVKTQIGNKDVYALVNIATP